jgi:WD40-like Beta Propeller Repeat
MRRVDARELGWLWAVLGAAMLLTIIATPARAAPRDAAPSGTTGNRQQIDLTPGASSDVRPPARSAATTSLPDGATGRIAYVVPPANSPHTIGALWTANPDGSGRRTVVTDADGGAIAPDMAPAGDRIAFHSWGTSSDPNTYVGPGLGIYAVPSSGDVPRRLSPSWPQDAWSCDTDASWSPDGSRIAFQHGGPINDVWDGWCDEDLFSIWTMDSSGGSRQQVVANGRGPEWSPNGQTLAFVRPDGIYTVNAQGGTATKLAQTWGNVLGMKWSPDGSQIAYAAYVSPGYELVVLDAATGSETFYMQGGLEPTWSPDGSLLAYQTPDFQPMLKALDGSFTGPLPLPSRGYVRSMDWGQTDLDLDLAGRFRPILRFDTSEPWRPLNVERFVDESFDDGQETPRHQLCSNLGSPGTCANWATGLSPPSRMLDSQLVSPGTPESAWPYIDVHGVGDEVNNFVSPHLDTCEHGSLNDCDEGPNTAIYFHASGPYPEANYRFLDYWLFYRYNKFDGGDHEADWEDVVVAVPNEADPQDFAWVGMSAHGPVYRYLRGALHCDNDLTTQSCGPEGAPNGRDRVVVFPANGSHANYPQRCDADLGGSATCARHDGGSGTIPVGEKGHDGEKPWGANDDPDALVEMPAWARWVGWWGFKDNASHVKTPGLQPYFDEPFAAICTEMGSSDTENCPPSGFQAAAAGDPCPAWNGPGVVATICDPTQVNAAMKAGTLGVQPGPLTTVDGAIRGSYRSSGGVAQIPGSALRAGQRLTLGAKLAPSARLLVRVQRNGRIRRLHFAAKDLPTGRRSLRLVPASGNSVELARPDGTHVKPSRSERAE